LYRLGFSIGDINNASLIFTKQI